MMQGTELSKLVDDYVSYNKNEDIWITLYDLCALTQMEKPEIEVVCHIAANAMDRVKIDG